MTLGKLTVFLAPTRLVNLQELCARGPPEANKSHHTPQNNNQPLSGVLNGRAQAFLFFFSISVAELFYMFVLIELLIEL